MKQKIIRIILFILGGILGLLLLYKLYLSYLPELKLLVHFDHHNEELLIKMVRSHGIEDLAFLFILNAICVAIPGLSNGIFCVLNGILYGPAFGFIVNWISDILGQIVLMQFLHKLYDIKHMSNSKIYKLLTTQKYPMVALTIGYLIPFIPSATVSYVNILINKNDFKKQLIPIVIGVSPFAYLYAYGGDSILHLDTSRIIKAAVMIVAVALIAAAILFIMKRVKKHTKKA
ncbi:TVP38/TMEM64 family protein [Lactobacillus gallinarum]|uniref:TVP38/TMEM64 family protein n=1 Tax=Lactobacillus gallinarum TaxID=52242 RepID=A0A1Y4QA11_9LACO|nr:VTT domain-containing protein [Lactobacillus gallinarum]OUQ02079.1 TVP38/TMEM64 family protein [Lactobacillus gallinarum]OUQ58162.1 TVP38/TMEM64 family protein [Lactobacillus gallinarum]OUQ77802.1 TVP38/TMEM64 family protein [Lactobacillus gallinarum]